VQHLVQDVVDLSNALVVELRIEVLSPVIQTLSEEEQSGTLELVLDPNAVLTIQAFALAQLDSDFLPVFEGPGILAPLVGGILDASSIVLICPASSCGKNPSDSGVRAASLSERPSIPPTLFSATIGTTISAMNIVMPMIVSVEQTALNPPSVV
jgi:hypothetical protein